MKNECLVQKAEMDRAVAEYEAAWPHYCRSCGGRGFTSEEYDPSPAGVSLGSGSLTMVDACSCLEEGRCPRCGEPTLPIPEGDDDQDQPETCSACGWDEESAGRPYDFVHCGGCEAFVEDADWQDVRESSV